MCINNEMSALSSNHSYLNHTAETVYTLAGKPIRLSDTDDEVNHRPAVQ